MKVYFRLTKWSSSRTPTNLIVYLLIHNQNWQPFGSKQKGTNDKNNIPVITYHIPLWTSPIKCHPSFPSVPLLSFDHPTDTNHPQPITSINYDRPQQLFYFNLIEFGLLHIPIVGQTEVVVRVGSSYLRPKYTFRGTSQPCQMGPEVSFVVYVDRDLWMRPKD